MVAGNQECRMFDFVKNLFYIGKLPVGAFRAEVAVDDNKVVGCLVDFFNGSTDSPFVGASGGYMYVAQNGDALCAQI